MDDEKPTAEKQGLLAKGLRAATFGAMSLLFQAMAPPPGTPIQAILDRARHRADEHDEEAATVEQLVMHQGGSPFMSRGHSSHSSHSSHVSGSGSRSYSPPVYNPAPYVPPAPVPTPVPVAPKPPPAAKKTTLRVKATPRARVFINGKEVGVSPTGPIEIPPGSVEIRLVHKLLGEKRKTIVVNAGDAQDVNIDW